MTQSHGVLDTRQDKTREALTLSVTQLGDRQVATCLVIRSIVVQTVDNSLSAFVSTCSNAVKAQTQKKESWSWPPAPTGWACFWLRLSSLAASSAVMLRMSRSSSCLAGSFTSRMCALYRSRISARLLQSKPLGPQLGSSCSRTCV